MKREFNKPLTKTQLKEIERKFSKFNIKTDLYRKYLSKNNIPKGKAKHHLYLISIFGDNDIIYETTVKYHTRLHLLLIADNIDRIKNNDIDINLCKIILGGTVRYAFGYQKFKNKNINFNVKDSWFFSNDLKFFEKYQDKLDFNTRSFFMKEYFSIKEHRENFSNRMKKYFSNQENRDKFSNKMKEYWNNLSDEEYEVLCNNIAIGTNSVDKSLWGIHTKDLWKDNSYRQHMKEVHTKESQIKRGTYVEESEEHKNDRCYKIKLNNFIRSQQSIINRCMNWSSDNLIDSIPKNDKNGRGFHMSILYSHRYLLDMCGLKYNFKKDKSYNYIKEHEKDFSFIDKSDIKWYSEEYTKKEFTKFLKQFC